MFSRESALIKAEVERDPGSVAVACVDVDVDVDVDRKMKKEQKESVVCAGAGICGLYHVIRFSDFTSRYDDNLSLSSSHPLSFILTLDLYIEDPIDCYDTLAIEVLILPLFDHFCPIEFSGSLNLQPCSLDLLRSRGIYPTLSLTHHLSGDRLGQCN